VILFISQKKTEKNRRKTAEICPINLLGHSRIQPPAELFQINEGVSLVG
jgi:hypothetical protein